MSEVELTERLDQAIDALLSDAPQSVVSDGAELARLVEVAEDLWSLPRATFKAQLRAELERATANKAPEVNAQPSWLPPGFRTVTPYVVVDDVHQEIAFIKQAFGAEGRVYGLGSVGGFHSEYRIGHSMLMIGGGGKGSQWKGESVPAVFHLYVENVDGVYQRALQAGGTSLMPPTDMDYGERSAGIEDAGGNHWYLATASGT